MSLITEGIPDCVFFLAAVFKIEVQWCCLAPWRMCLCVRMLMCNLSLYGPRLMPFVPREEGMDAEAAAFFIQ